MRVASSPADSAALPCPACGILRHGEALALHDWTYTGEGPFAYVRCQECRTVYAGEKLPPAELQRYYPPGYAGYTQDAGRSLRSYARRIGLAKRCRTVEGLRQGGRLLDIGCGSGAFLGAMQARGRWQVVGLERDQGAAHYARDRGLDVRVGDIDTTDGDFGAFDVITLWDVLEHLEQPAASLDRIIRRLAPGGWLVLRTPDAATRQARWFGSRWAGYDAPRHRAIYTRGALEGMLRRCELEPRTIPGPSGSTALASLSMRNLALAQGWPRWAADVQIHPLAQAAWWPACTLFDAVEGGAELLVAAQRPGVTNHPKG